MKQKWIICSQQVTKDCRLSSGMWLVIKYDCSPYATRSFWDKAERQQDVTEKKTLFYKPGDSDLSGGPFSCSLLTVLEILTFPWSCPAVPWWRSWPVTQWLTPSYPEYWFGFDFSRSLSLGTPTLQMMLLELGLSWARHQRWIACAAVRAFAIAGLSVSAHKRVMPF